MKYTPTIDKSVCQQKANEVFDRLRALIKDVVATNKGDDALTPEEVKDALYILKLWADYCDLIGLDIPSDIEVRKASFDTAEMHAEAAQDVFYALQARAQDLEERTHERLSETQRAEMATIHALAADAGTGCGSVLMSGGGGK